MAILMHPLFGIGMVRVPRNVPSALAKGLKDDKAIGHRVPETAPRSAIAKRSMIPISRTIHNRFLP
jgi:hypothetical protein